MNKLLNLLLSASMMGCPNKHMVYFPDKPCLIPTYNYMWLTCDDFHVLVDGVPLIVPKGFKTDLASIPRILWSLESPYKYSTIAPSILHDYLYSYPMHYTRKEIDSIFYNALVWSGTSKTLSSIYYVGVRLFGRSHFKKDK